jgi:hypothetical protein
LSRRVRIARASLSSVRRRSESSIAFGTFQRLTTRSVCPSGLPGVGKASTNGEALLVGSPCRCSVAALPLYFACLVQSDGNIALPCGVVGTEIGQIASNGEALIVSGQCSRCRRVRCRQGCGEWRGSLRKRRALPGRLPQKGRCHRTRSASPPGFAGHRGSRARHRGALTWRRRRATESCGYSRCASPRHIEALGRRRR